MKAEAEPKTGTPRSFWTLERKVPLLVWALLAASVASGLALSYGAVRDIGRTAAERRMEPVNEQLRAMLAVGLPSTMETLHRVAADERVVSYLRDPASGDSAAVAALLDGIGTTSAALHVRTADGAPLIAAGLDTIAVPRFTGVDEETGISTLVVVNNRGGFWAAAPVLSAERTVGWVTAFSPVVTVNADIVATLIGRGATIVFGSSGEGAWVGATGAPVGRPIEGPIESGDVFHYRDATGVARLMRVDAIPGTPLLVGITMPLAVIDEPANQFLRGAAVIGVLVTLFGAVAAWGISRRITGPILRLRSAAAAIAGGEYSRRVPEVRSDELGDLARTFNVMTTHIQSAHDEVENRYERAQSLAMELEMANEELEEAMAETDAMRQRAQEANRAKSEFLATMSHEIRTPINAMVGYADLLQLGIGGGISGEQGAYLDRIKASGSHLTQLIDEVLDFAKIEAGQLRVLDEISGAGDAIERAVATIEPAAREKGVRIRRASFDECFYLGDPQRVEQILLNLLSNGVKFTPEGGWIELSCDSDVRPPAETELHPGGDYICIIVADSGVGVAEARLSEIFEPFVQGDSGYTREHGGTGLGLSISRRLARLMRGDVTAERRAGGGSVFSLWLRAPAGHEGGWSREAEKAAGSRVER